MTDRCLAMLSVTKHCATSQVSHFKNPLTKMGLKLNDEDKSEI